MNLCRETHRPCASAIRRSPERRKGTQGSALWFLSALVHGSAQRTEPPSPGPGSRHAVAVRHPKAGHRIENLTSEVYLDSLARQCTRSHTSADDRLVSKHCILNKAAPAVA